MQPFITRACLAQISLACLLTLADCLIEVYKEENGTLSRDAVYTISNDFKSIKSRQTGVADAPIYLKAATPADACHGTLVEPTPWLWKENQWAGFVLLTDDTPCSTPSDDDDLAEQAGDHLSGKLVIAQEKGYVGVVIYPARSGTGPPGIRRTGSRTQPLPAAFSDGVTDQLKIDVHFVSYDDGNQLKKFAYNSSSDISYRLNFTFVPDAQSTANEGGSLPSDSNWTTFRPPSITHPAEEPHTATMDSRLQWILQDYLSYKPIDLPVVRPVAPALWMHSSSRTQESSQLSLGACLGAAFGSGAVFVLLITSLAYCWRRRKIRAIALGTAPPMSIKNLMEAEIAEIYAIRAMVVLRLIESLIAQSQANEQEEHRRANGVPLTAREMEQLVRVEITQPTEDLCTTCQQNFTIGEIKTVLPCNHVGHKACLTTWLTTYSRNCPVCRQPVCQPPEFVVQHHTPVELSILNLQDSH
ncbi:uncharacterized protein LOC129600965 isoform X2 [Paramacrobiotus metropolitanus]|uniref:uncharacterized protein LOC129600965 isoform X2 n=1 Tax=Paramacrobiotus metropolitanus TaxID=2943436 RepID=UPI0024463EF5|nr:uncharacterized protein LOC129600965 isoform X2 [Paramacrobiotus metropolitanus]